MAVYQIYMLSSPGTTGLEHVVQLCSDIKSTRSVGNHIVYVPAGNLVDKYEAQTRQVLESCARLYRLDVGATTPAEFESALIDALLIYIPGGNTFLLNHRLKTSGLFEPIVAAVKGGIPLVTFSAGAIMCGQNILVAEDMNCCGATSFSGFGFIEYNIGVHYPSGDVREAARRDKGFAQYHAFHDDPILAMEDGAMVYATNGSLRVSSGVCWLFEKGADKRSLNSSDPLPRIIR